MPDSGAAGSGSIDKRVASDIALSVRGIIFCRRDSTIFKKSSVLPAWDRVGDHWCPCCLDITVHLTADLMHCTISLSSLLY